MTMKRKSMIFVLMVVLFIGVLFYLPSKRKLTVTGYAYRGDSINIMINGNGYFIKIDSGSNKNIQLLIDKDIKYRNMKNPDEIHIKLDSENVAVIDTFLQLNKKNVKPRLFFDKPDETNSKREVFLINDSSMLIY